MATLDFKGKQVIRNYHLMVKYHALDGKKGKSLTGKINLHDNLIIHGDNLIALKALLPTYAGKVKCIYIDPPYNTGNEGWKYNDNVNSPMMQEWLRESVAGRSVERDDLTRHDKWLCMMMPRLKLLRELLREDGIIFISCDDNEAHHLRMLLDEVFGEVNFITTVIWQKKYTRSNDAQWFSDNHDFILVYARFSEQCELNLQPRTEKQKSAYSNPDNHPKGLWKATPLHAKSGTNTGFSYTFKNGIVWSPPGGTYPRFSEDTLDRLDKNDEIWFGKDGKSIPSRKTFLSDAKIGVTPVTIWLYDEVGHNHEANNEIKAILGEGVFDSPKPIRLIKKMLELSTSDEDIVLDSFAGSGTTAHAVLDLNKDDGGNRKFILVECEDYADTITAERVRRVIKGVPDAKDEALKKGLGGTFSYFELGKPLEITSILNGKNLPDYKELARYIFFTATGAELDESKIDADKHSIGESSEYRVYLLYQPDLDYLKSTALTLDNRQIAWRL